jgi:hemerythrin-like domain-containing protein
MKTARREFLVAATTLGFAGLTGPVVAVAAEPVPKAAEPGDQPKPGQGSAAGADEVSAPEDLMREHGVLRRILGVYEEGLRRMHNQEEIAPEVFHQCATLVRKFVEDYHEKLEETFIFPVFEKKHELVPLVTILRKQHQAGRALTDVILLSANAKRFQQAEPRAVVARTCRDFIRMYRPHAAREDTVLFPALHKLMTAADMDKLGDQFEDEEDRLFGKDGFEHTVDTVAAIEKQLNIFDLDRFTPETATP